MDVTVVLRTPDSLPDRRMTAKPMSVEDEMKNRKSHVGSATSSLNVASST
jgi:hypothetical protein